MKTKIFLSLIIISIIGISAREAMRKGRESTDITWTFKMNVATSAFYDSIDYKKGMKSAIPGFKVYNNTNDTMTIGAQALENTDTTEFTLPPLSWFPVVFRAVFYSHGDSIIIGGK